MPARYIGCVHCGLRLPTFLSDEELEKLRIPCPECGCPIMKLEEKPLKTYAYAELACALKLWGVLPALEQG